MDVLPRSTGTARFWHHVEPSFAAVAVRAGRGSDADPLVLFDRPRGRALIAVFGGDASVRAQTEAWFVGGNSAATLATRITGSAGAQEFAGIAVCTTGSAAEWNALRAGTSRCYTAEPETRLRELGPAPQEGHIALPCVLLCATDGFFARPGTLDQVETLLWGTLLSAQNTTHWAVQLINHTADRDASFALVALGFENFDTLRASFRQSLQRVHVLSAEESR